MPGLVVPCLADSNHQKEEWGTALLERSSAGWLEAGSRRTSDWAKSKGLPTRASKKDEELPVSYALQPGDRPTRLKCHDASQSRGEAERSQAV